MSNTFHPAPAAELLTEAWQSGSLLKELPQSCRPQTVDQGYDIQDQLIANLGEPVVGWKLGVGSPKGKAQAGITLAIAGRVLKSRLFKDGDTIRMPNQAPVTVEFEIAYVLGRDVAPGESLADPLAAVAATHVAFELVLARFVDRRAVGWPSFTADNAGFNALVLGPEVSSDEVAAIRRSIVVAEGDIDKAKTATGEDAIDPVMALGEMFHHARDRGLTLSNGTIVSTGTQSMPFNTSGASTFVTARFAGGTLSARLAVPMGA